MPGPRRNDLLVPLLMVIGDFLAITGAFAASFYLRFDGPLASIFPVTLGFPPLDMYMIGAVIIAPIWIFLFHSRRVYRPRRETDLSTEFFQIARTVTFGMLVVLSLAFFYREFSYSRLVFVVIWALSILFIGGSRGIVLTAERMLYKRGKELRNVLLAGVNPVAQNIARWLQQRPSAGYKLIGYAADESERLENVNVPRLCDFSGLAEAIEKHRIETVIVCLNRPDTNLLGGIMDALTGRNVQLLLQSEMIGVTPARLRVQELFGLPFLGVKDIPMSTWGRVVKRSFDVVCSFIVLLLFAPAGLLISFLIRLESGSPVFYSQRRVGMDGKEFDLLKFRTMRADAESATGPTWTRKNDPRVTRLGRWLRRFSIDEIPQFINVLRGDMSIVGPRPERPEFVSQFVSYVPKYLERHRLKTGLTGWAQVNGLRGEVPIVERTKYDLYYIENWSFALDMRIIFKTFRAVLFGKDAY